MASHKNVRQLPWFYSYPMTHLTKFTFIEFPNGITVEGGTRSLNTIELHILKSTLILDN